MDGHTSVLLQLFPRLSPEQLSVRPLPGGITNRNYRVDAGGESYVLRLSGENTALLGIDRECEYGCCLAAARLGAGPEVVAFVPEYGALLTRFVEGRALAPGDASRPEVMRRMVETLKRYHSGPPGPGRFSPFDTVREYYRLASVYGVVFPAGMGRALEALWTIEASLPVTEPSCPCHNDLLPANFIDNGSTVKIIDWEYAGMGDRFFDLGNLAVNHELDATAEEALLHLYFGELRPKHLWQLRLMRLASDMREALWGFLQSGISSLDFDFFAYGSEHLARFLTAWESVRPALPVPLAGAP